MSNIKNTQKKNVLFITGTSGFVGTNLLKNLNPDEFENIYCLDRTENSQISGIFKDKKCTFINADIKDLQKYSHALKLSNIILHIAALTGKAKPEDYFNVNSECTRLLLNHCNKSQLKRFIYISSIAVNFKDISDYYYAQSKIKAEELVRKSGLPYTILRPTIIIGRNSPILQILSMLAKMVVIPIFGNGSVKIQPIYINDLIDCILNVINNDITGNQAFDLGGPDQITIEKFIGLIHDKLYKKEPRIVHIPVYPIKNVFRLLEKVFLPVLPFTAGQIASFTNDGTIQHNSLISRHLTKMQGVNEMVNFVLDEEKHKELICSLENEGRKFCSYLTGHEPDNYIIKKYIKGNLIHNLDDHLDFFNRILILFAIRNPFFTKIVDSYTSIFYRTGAVRKKFVLLMSILECSVLTNRSLDSVSEKSKILFIIKFTQKAFVFACTFLLSMIIFMPFHMVSMLKQKHCKNGKNYG